VESIKSGRSSEANTLRADLKAGRLIEQAVHQSRLAYQFVPNGYTFEALSAVLRLQDRLRSVRLLQEITSTTSKCAAEAVIDAARETLAAMAPPDKEQLLDEVADLFRELPEA
jgi:hypothetical protein